MTELCEILRGADDNIVFIGDFNLPGIDWEQGQAKDARGRLLVSTAVEEGLEQLISFPTHVKGNILDLLLTNCPDKVLDVLETGRLGKSDHCMIMVELNFQPDNQVRGSRRYNWN